MSVRIRHQLPGRTRLELARWPEAGTLRAIEARLVAAGCRLVADNPLTRTLLLVHDRATPASQAAGIVAASLEAGAAPEEPEGWGGETVQPERDLDRLAVASPAEAIALLGAERCGLGAEEAARRLAAFGPNALPPPGGRSRSVMLAGQFTSFPVALLLGSAVLSLATGGVFDAVVTVGVVAVNAGIGFTSENSTERLIRRLSRPVEHSATVRRGGREIVVPAHEIVPGDVIVLAPGTQVPADGILIEAGDLTVDESILTGESLPVEKIAGAMERPPSGVADRANVVHSGTVVTGGGGLAIVARTGRQTEMAATRALIGTARAPRPAIETKLASLGGRLALACVAGSGLVFAIGLLRGEPLVAVAKSAIALAVSAIPEGLPAVATMTLARGAAAMEGERALVRALPAIEVIGAIDTICLDKTGTLTENRMAVVAAHVGDETFEAGSVRDWADIDDPGLRALAETVALCNEADLGNGGGSATELALLRFAAAAGTNVAAARGRFPRTGLRNRNQARRWMLTEHGGAERVGAAGPFIAIKGAPDEVLASARRERVGDEERPLDGERRRAILDVNERLARKGFRILGVARREGGFADADLDDTIWLGLVALADPVRAEAREAVDIFHRAGIRTVMITGDQPATALAVAESLRLSRTGIIPVAEGSEIAHLDEAALGELAKRTSVFARVSPADKLRIVSALQSVGRSVAMIGDGVNDGPALRAAAVGVAMGRNGTDVAREVADIVIADDDLRELARAIARGRATEDNVRAAVRYFLSTNLSEMLVMLAESLHGRGELETPMELFWLNLVTDILPALGLAMAEPRGDVMSRPPRPADAPIFVGHDARSMAIDGSGIAAAALAAHFITLARAGPGPRARTATFLTLALAQIAQAWVLRDRSPGAGEALIVSERRLESMLAMAAGLLALPFALRPLRRLLGIGPLSLADLLLSAILAAAAFGTAETRRIIAYGSAAAAPLPALPPGRTAPGPVPPRSPA